MFSNKSDVYLFSFQCSVSARLPDCLSIIPKISELVKCFLNIFLIFYLYGVLSPVYRTFSHVRMIFVLMISAVLQSNKKALLKEGIKKGPGSLLLSRLHTIVAVMMLNFRVRDGNGCVHHAIAARSSRDPSKPDTSSLLFSTLSNLGQVLGLLVPPR